MGHCTPAAQPPASPQAAAGTDLPVGDAPAPAAFPDLAAARFYGDAAMRGADAALRREHGGMRLSQVMIDIAEVAIRRGREGYRFDAEAWIGGDLNRLVAKSEGAGDFGRAIDEAEVQLLYARAVGPYETVQLGVRQDLNAGVRRSYASVGFEALAPFWFDVEGTVFVSDNGEVFARAEADYDLRVTNWWVLQPRAELDWSAQAVPAMGLGAGVTEAQAGLRLRWEGVREFAPYMGVAWERKLGGTARAARAAGEATGGWSLVAGVRAWF